MDRFCLGDAAARALTSYVVACRRVSQFGNEVFDCNVELVFSRKLRVGARRKVCRASGVGRDRFGTGLSELAHLLAVQVFELEP